MLPVVLLVLTASAPTAALGTPLKQDGYSLRPPQGFRLARKELFQGTRVGAVALEPTADRRLSAALMDASDDTASTLLLTWVEEPFSATPGDRDAFATATVRHFSEELGLKLSLETARAVGGPSPRVEVLGTLRMEAQVRRILVAAFEGQSRHVVATFSVPSGRFEELQPSIAASLDTFRVDTGTTAGLSRGLVGALAGAALGLLLVSLGLWRSRQKRSARSG